MIQCALKGRTCFHHIYTRAYRTFNSIHTRSKLKVFPQGRVGQDMLKGKHEKVLENREKYITNKTVGDSECKVMEPRYKPASKPYLCVFGNLYAKYEYICTQTLKPIWSITGSERTKFITTKRRFSVTSNSNGNTTLNRGKSNNCCIIAETAAGVACISKKQQQDAAYWRGLKERIVPVLKGLSCTISSDGLREVNVGAKVYVDVGSDAEKISSGLVDINSLGYNMSVLCNALERTNFRDKEFLHSIELLTYMHMDFMSLYELSVVCKTLATLYNPNTQFLQAVAARCVKRAPSCSNYSRNSLSNQIINTKTNVEKSDFFGVPSTLLKRFLRIGADSTQFSQNKLSRYSDIGKHSNSVLLYMNVVSWVCLLSVLSKWSIRNPDVFNVAGDCICNFLDAHKPLIYTMESKLYSKQKALLIEQKMKKRVTRRVETPSEHIVTAVEAYARLGFLHLNLLNAVEDCFGLLHLTESHILRLQNAFAKLGKVSPLLSSLGTVN